MTVEEFQRSNGIIGKSKQIKDLIDITMQVASSDISVLIYGESGVGKEVFAKALHNFSHRSEKRLVSVNCGAIPEGLLESELFGHKKGSFTGAIEDRKGYFEIADGGTLFLDEIGEMPLTTQVKLLRVIETREFMPIGSELVKKVDIRLLAATNKDLQKQVDAKKFRADLYFRLKAVTLTIPPLRERIEDIPLMAFEFLRKFSASNKKVNPELSDKAVDLLMRYNWPGNIRELKNVIETSAALNRNGMIDAEDILPLINNFSGKEESKFLPVHLDQPSTTLDREMIYRALIEIKKDLIELKEMVAKNPGTISPMNYDEIKEVSSIDKLEKEAIVNALLYTKGNKRKASRLLRISERTLYRKLKEYDIH